MWLRPTHLVYVFFALSIFCQAQSDEKLISLYFEEVRNGKFPVIPKTLLLEYNYQRTANALDPYLSDSSINVRLKSIDLVHAIGINATQASIREAVVLKLITKIYDRHSSVSDQIFRHLMNFSVDEFNAAAKDSLKHALISGAPHYPKLIRLIGFIDLKDMIESIRKLNTPSNSKSVRWSALLALTRMQDAAAKQELMSKVKKLPVNDDVIYNIFPDLIYTRDREAFDYMITLLHSDDKYCTSADAENEVPIPCGYRIMEMLAPVIQNYPLTLDESGDIETDDYLAALASVRYWLMQNKNYVIVTNTY